MTFRMNQKTKLAKMKQLNKVETFIYVAGAILMVLGAGISLTGWAGYPYLFCIGAICYASMQLQQRYEGKNVTIRRLRRLMILSDFLILLAGVLMLAGQTNTLGLSQLTFLQYVYNKWVVVLLIAALIQLYVTHRIDYELKKEYQDGTNL